MTFGAIYPVRKNPHRTAQDIAAARRQLDPPTKTKEEDGATTTVYWRGAERGNQVILSGRDNNSTMHFVTYKKPTQYWYLFFPVTKNENLPEKKRRGIVLKKLYVGGLAEGAGCLGVGDMGCGCHFMELASLFTSYGVLFLLFASLYIVFFPFTGNGCPSVLNTHSSREMRSLSLKIR
jgi:hypothetical protein